MSREEVFTYFFIVSSVHVKILYSIQAPSLPVQVQKPYFPFLSHSLLSNALFLVKSPTLRKGSNTVIIHNTTGKMVFEPNSNM